MNPTSMVSDQCLFGYDDGHRLLASSMRLGDELAELTELSDLAPGVVFDKVEGYVTGVPAPKIGRYALMRTWPAPEMSRPGCVWTHVLLLDPSVLETLPDLSSLLCLFRRPGNLLDQKSYREQIILDDRIVSPIDPHLSNSRILRNLFLTLYDSDLSHVSVDYAEQVTSGLFAIWSQQWPRLRRNFRFQTTLALDRRSASRGKLDVYFQLANLKDIQTKPANTEWVDFAIADILRGPGGPLRSFLWRYGIDVRRQRGSFRPLVEVAQMDLTRGCASGAQLVDLVSKAFPSRNDALRLKQSIIDGTLVPSAQLDVLWFVLAEGGGEIFPLPSAAGVERLTQLWPTQSDGLLHLAEKAADIKGELGPSIIEVISRAIPSEEFWMRTESCPRLRERMVAARPELLISDSASILDDKTFVSFVESLELNLEIARLLISKALSRDNSRLVDILIERFPQEVASEVVAAIDGGLYTVGEAWMRALISKPSLLLDPVVMSRITRASLLFGIAERVGWLSGPVVSAGIQPWLSGLNGASIDLPNEKREAFEAFLVGLALACGGDGGQNLFERYFGGVHKKILSDRLPWIAINFLSPYLPDVGWIKSWDTGLRLRLAVAAAYVRYGYSAESFAALGRNKKERAMLVEAAADVYGGEHLAVAAARV